MASVVANLADQMAAQVTNAKKTSGNSGGLSSSNKTLAENYQTFLTLLTTQLKHQDPTAPTDTNQFMQQLTQFSSVEQELRSNDTLTKILDKLGGNGSTAAVSYLGNYVTAKGSNADLSDGVSAKWGVNFTKTPKEGSSTVTIRDSAGAVVYVDKAHKFKAGDQNYTWDGRNTAGGQSPAGTYSIAIEATDELDAPITASTQVAGRVDAVEVSGAEPLLTVGGKKIKLSDVTSVSLPS